MIIGVIIGVNEFKISVKFCKVIFVYIVERNDFLVVILNIFVIMNIIIGIIIVELNVLIIDFINFNIFFFFIYKYL